MAQPQLQADFFVRSDGISVTRAPALKRSERNKIVILHGEVCAECRSPAPLFRRHYDILAGEVDHIIPRARGGQNDRENLRLLCKSCNASKGAA